MNVQDLKDILKNNYEHLEKILEQIGCGKIKTYQVNNEIRCAIDTDDDSNGNSIRLNTETLYAKSFSDRLSFKGDIIALVQELIQGNFNDSISLICKTIGIDYNSLDRKKVEKRVIFGGYYKDIKKQIDMSEDIVTYSETILQDNRFVDMPSYLFLEDNISLATQKEFKIMYDLESERICIPWRNNMGELVGIVGRFNGNNHEKLGISKYMPIIPTRNFNKSRVLFGFSENYKYIQKTQTVFISESEKTVLQAHSFGIKNIIAVGSHNLSQQQTNLIKSLQCKRVIIGYDEDIKDEEFLISQCKMLQYNNSFFDCKIGYILDKENKFLCKDSKSSITDNGKDIFQSLCKECITWIK